MGGVARRVLTRSCRERDAWWCVVACGVVKQQTCQHSNQEWVWIGDGPSKDGGREMHGGEDETGWRWTWT